MQRLEGDVVLLHALYDAFCQDAPLRLESLSIAMESQDAASLQRQAHALKGSAAIVGALRCAQMAAALERQAQSRVSTQEMAQAWKLLQEETRQVLVELQAQQPQQPPAPSLNR